jgi:hypothetical protein
MLRDLAFAGIAATTVLAFNGRTRPSFTKGLVAALDGEPLFLTAAFFDFADNAATTFPTVFLTDGLAAVFVFSGFAADALVGLTVFTTE